MKTIRDHVEEMFKDVPKSKERTNVMNEIILNLEEKVDDLVFDGKDKEDAINKALIDFGAIDDIKKELIDKKKAKQKYPGIAFGFSVGGSCLIIGALALTNYYLFPQVVWFLFPTFGILWWPLARCAKWLKSRRKKI